MHICNVELLTAIEHKGDVVGSKIGGNSLPKFETLNWVTDTSFPNASNEDGVQGNMTSEYQKKNVPEITGPSLIKVENEP